MWEDQFGGVSVPLEQPESLITRYIREQQALGAAEQFARMHDAGYLPEQDPVYKELIPLSVPEAGQQYAFEVNLDECTGCKACVTACHNLNGLDEDETWRAVGTVLGGPPSDSFTQTITTACHHCVEPGCLLGCPVKAYEKDPKTGIVHHLDDQCIGCQYCVFQCPYEVPQYSASRGIVRKCDLCRSRLQAQEAPACVQGCPNDAIQITIVDQADVRTIPERFVDVAGAPSSALTLPTTQYKTQKQQPANVRPADVHTVRVQHAHFPLVVMLVLTQLSVGSFLGSWLLPSIAIPEASIFQTIAALTIGGLALGASLLHLGRPLYAFRAVLGLRTSWLSREILAFGLFMKVALVYTALTALPLLPAEWHWLGLSPKVFGVWHTGFAGMTGLLGILGVGCSAMIYQSTPRSYWNRPQTSMKFGLTAMVLGLSLTVCTVLGFRWWLAEASVLSTGYIELGLVGALLLSSTLKLWIEAHILKAGDSVKTNMRFESQTEREHTLQKTVHLLKHQLHPITQIRFVLGLGGGVVLPSLILIFGSQFSTGTLFVIAIAILAINIIGEFLERTLFFAAGVGPKMPGI